MMRNRSTKRGFSLLTVILLLALATLSAAVVLDIIHNDQQMMASRRQGRDALETAEGGLMEALNDASVLANLPDPSTSQLSSTFTAPAASRFGAAGWDGVPRSYTATIEWVRVAPMLESSQDIVRAAIFEVTAVGSIDNWSSAEVRAEIYRVATHKSGVVQPNLHAR